MNHSPSLPNAAIRRQLWSTPIPILVQVDLGEPLAIAAVNIELPDYLSNLYVSLCTIPGGDLWVADNSAEIDQDPVRDTVVSFIDRSFG